MKKVLLAVAIVLVMTFALAGCGTDSKDISKEAGAMKNQTFELEASRDKSVKIPVAVTVPEVAGGEKCPVVVIVHGFLGSKDENGIYYGDSKETGFTSLSEQLYKAGIGTIRIDQPACGESKDDLRNYTPENCISDINDAYKYCLENYSFDENRVGLVGHSMGGKIGPTFASQHKEIKTMVLLNPAGDNGSTSLQTAAGAGLDYPVLEAAALKDGKETKNEPLSEYAGVDLYMSTEFFKEVNKSETGNQIKEFVRKGNKALMIYGDKDEIINPETYPWIIKNTGIESVCVKGMGHELGIDTGNVNHTETVVDVAASYLCMFMSK